MNDESVCAPSPAGHGIRRKHKPRQGNRRTPKNRNEPGQTPMGAKKTQCAPPPAALGVGGVGRACRAGAATHQGHPTHPPRPPHPPTKATPSRHPTQGKQTPHPRQAATPPKASSHPTQGKQTPHPRQADTPPKPPRHPSGAKATHAAIKEETARAHPQIPKSRPPHQQQTKPAVSIKGIWQDGSLKATHNTTRNTPRKPHLSHPKQAGRQAPRPPHTKPSAWRRVREADTH
jgi:hypothetical protein